MKMSQNSLEQFNNGFFTMSGAVAVLALVYPLYHTSRVLCTRYFKRTPKCEC
jgi:hypothetical protein